MRFKPDLQIFGGLQFSAARLYRFCRSKAYLFRGVQIRWSCDPSLLKAPKDETPAEAVLHFPGGLRDSLDADIGGAAAVVPAWGGEADLPAGPNGQRTGRLEWAVAWLEQGDGFIHSYCNTVPTSQGGTHETGFRNALLKGLRAWGEQRSNRRAAQITAEDLIGGPAAKLPAVIRQAPLQGQAHEEVYNPEAARPG